MSNSFAIPWTVAHQALLSRGFPRQEYWSGLPFPSPGDLPNPHGSNPLLLGRWVLSHWATWEALSIWEALLIWWHGYIFKIFRVGCHAWNPSRSCSLYPKASLLAEFFPALSWSVFVLKPWTGWMRATYVMEDNLLCLYSPPIEMLIQETSSLKLANELTKYLGTVAQASRQ